jgi:hypothetical protein
MNGNNVVFSISTQMEMEGRQLKALKPNKDGVYTGIPLTVIGCDSRNNCSYEKQSVLQCLTDMKSRFAANVTTGDMEGEWGHPFLAGDTSLERLLFIDRKNVSHFFTKVYGVDCGNDIIMIYGDVKPFGPYGKYLEDSFQDGMRNTSFSLRSAAAKIGTKNGIVQKKMLSLVTFDAVDGPGFLKASKRFRDPNVATESYGIALDPSRKFDVADVELTADKEQFLKTQEKLQSVGQESIITDQRILDAFMCDKITLRDTVLTRGTSTKVFTSEGKPVSLFDMCFSN